MFFSFIILLTLLALSASFSSFETALFSITPLDRHRLKGGGGLSSFIVKTWERPREVLTTVLFGNEMVNVAISILAGGIAYDLFQEANPRAVYLITTAVTTFFLLVLGEIFPKNIAIRNPVIVSQVLVLPFRLFSWLMTPFRRILTSIADRVVTLFGADPRRGPMSVEEELRSLLEMGREAGTLADFERTLIHNAIDFSGIPVSRMMVPRQKIVGLPIGTSFEKLLEFLRQNRFSRLPIFEEDLDHVVGVLHVKELVDWRIEEGNPTGRTPSGRAPFELGKILKPYAEFRPDERLSVIFQEFKRKRIHLGLIREGGVTVGLITMDDLLRRLFP